MIALKFGFEEIEKLGGMQRIEEYTFSLAEYLYTSLAKLKHNSATCSSSISMLPKWSGHLCIVYGWNLHDETKPSSSNQGIPLYLLDIRFIILILT